MDVAESTREENPTDSSVEMPSVISTQDTSVKPVSEEQPNSHEGKLEAESETCQKDLSNRARMLERVSKSDGHFKHQQRDEPDLTYSEKLRIATELLDQKPSTFLARFGKFLETEDLQNFQAMADDYFINFHLQEIKKRLNVHTNHTIIRNRRYEAMKELVEKGEYFADESLKERDPLLYEQMVGQHLSGDEINAQVNKSDLRFSTILISHLDIIRNNELYDKQKIKEATEMEQECAEESSDDEADDSEEESELESEEDEKPTISSEEKRMLREEFIRIMQLRFLNGEDQDFFDYTKVDANEEYDSLDIRERDEQEKYFDNEDPETLDMETNDDHTEDQAQQRICLPQKLSAQTEVKEQTFEIDPKTVEMQ